MRERYSTANQQENVETENFYNYVFQFLEIVRFAGFFVFFFFFFFLDILISSKIKFWFYYWHY